MNKNPRSNAILVEMTLVILFFALSSAVMLKLFDAAHQKSEMSRTDTLAAISLQDAAERFYISALAPEEFLFSDGYEYSESRFARNFSQYQLLADVAQAGDYSEIIFTAMDGSREIASVRAARYAPGEAVE